MKTYLHEMKSLLNLEAVQLKKQQLDLLKVQLKRKRVKLEVYKKEEDVVDGHPRDAKPEHYLMEESKH